MNPFYEIRTEELSVIRNARQLAFNVYRYLK
ncbi:hypothetical protein PAECIP111890_01502 [Paenibacillus sp. JJ-223]|nr:hypothetical protein PAECIP111890_01502 [Paenibacillus sp. JJ-223]